MALIADHLADTLCLQQLEDRFLLPAEGSGGMFMKNMSSMPELLIVDAGHKRQMTSTFLQHLSYSLGVHLLVVL